ncbi:MAG: hypothetical protein ABJN04_12970 [Hyphomicrobiales bacterium]
MRYILSLLFLLSACLQSHAFALSGEVTGGYNRGSFVKLHPSKDIVVGNDTYQDHNLYVFDEDQNIVLPKALAVDIGPQGLLIPKGTIVASHYVFFDPEYGTSQLGYIEFDAAILGIATSTWTLQASDFLANTDVTYLNPILRGLEWEDSVWIDKENPFRVWVNWAASSPGDYIRVFTAASPSV